MSRPTFIQIVRSVMAAAIGVQSQKNRERDFQHGSAGIYIIAGLIGTLFFVLLLVLIVSVITG